MNYDEALNQLTARTFFNSFAGLGRMREELSLLGNPENCYPVIHIAGTNGKGSVAAMLHSVLTEAGYRVGLFTSPYLEDFRERIRVGNELISRYDLTVLTEQVLGLTLKYPEPPNQFEMITLIAFLYFREQKADIVVLETGLGGTFDPTNVLSKPLLDIITNIGMDHSAILGNTIPEIAGAKAGILKESVPCVLYPSCEEAMAVFRERAKSLSVPLIAVRKEDVLNGCYSEGMEHFSYKGEEYEVSLPGEHQRYNAAVVLEAVSVLESSGFRISESHLKKGLSRVKWPARLECLSKEPLIFLDGGHNPQCMEAVTRFLKDNYSGRNIIFFVSILADKDYDTMLRLISGTADKMYFIPLAVPRAIRPEELSGLSSRYGFSVLSGGLEELENVMKAVPKDSVLVFTGSLFLAGRFRSLLKSFLMT